MAFRSSSDIFALLSGVDQVEKGPLGPEDASAHRDGSHCHALRGQSSHSPLRIAPLGNALFSILLDARQRAIRPGAAWKEQTLLTLGIALEHRLRPGGESVLVEDEFALGSERADDVRGILVEEDGALHHLAGGTDQVVVGTRGIADVAAESVDMSDPW